LNPRRPRTFPRLYLYSANIHRRPVVNGHDEDVVQMNGIRKSDSGEVQCAPLASGKTAQAPAVKAEQGKVKALNANAWMGRHHRHYRHHRHHEHIGLHKTHAKHIAVKHVTPAAKRS